MFELEPDQTFLLRFLNEAYWNETKVGSEDGKVGRRFKKNRSIQVRFNLSLLI